MSDDAGSAQPDNRQPTTDNDLCAMRYRTHIGHKVLAVVLAIGLLGWVVQALL